MSDLSGTCCVTVPTKDPEALASVVLELLSNEEKINMLRANAYHWSANNDMEHSAKELSTIYTQLINSE
jgi:glycosyltransferase involved in cell wall biosynthesis